MNSGRKPRLGIWGLRTVIACFALISAYVLYLGAVSIHLGLQHRNQDGYWVPVGAGALIIVILFRLFYVLFRRARKMNKNGDSIRIGRSRLPY